MSSPRTHGQLPRGRHGLSRDEVVASQRGRILFGLMETVAEKGYASTSVADIIERAGVSRETFYEQFSSKQDCFLAAFDTAGEAFIGALVSARIEGTPAERVDALFGAYLETLANQPAFARILLVEVNAAGPEALRRRSALQHRFSEALVGVLGTADPEERFAFELAIAGIGSMVSVYLIDDELDGLRGLRAPVVALVQRLLGS